jgi:hypothetical protein
MRKGSPLVKETRENPSNPHAAATLGRSHLRYSFVDAFFARCISRGAAELENSRNRRYLGSSFKIGSFDEISIGKAP